MMGRLNAILRMEWSATFTGSLLPVAPAMAAPKITTKIKKSAIKAKKTPKQLAMVDFKNSFIICKRKR
jgi:hypothetical protein